MKARSGVFWIDINFAFTQGIISDIRMRAYSRLLRLPVARFLDERAFVIDAIPADEWPALLERAAVFEDGGYLPSLPASPPPESPSPQPTDRPWWKFW